jgi:hypothetical protein
MDTAYDYDDPIPDPIQDPTEWQHNELIYFLTRSPEMKKTTRRAIQQAAYAGAGVLIGGIALGPVGGLFGGITGSFVGYVRSEDYQGAVAHIAKLSPEQRQRLLKAVGAVLLAAGATSPQLATAETFRTALITLAAQEPVRDAIWKTCFQSAREV